MTQGHEVEIFISLTGELKIHIKGMSGPECVKVGKALARGQGKLAGKSLTSEYYEKAKTTSKTGIYVRK